MKGQINKSICDVKTLTIGWDSEFQEQEIISHQLYIHETGEEIFIDLIKEGRTYISFTELVLRIKAIHPDVNGIMLVAHFSRAELASLYDGRELVFNGNLIYSSKTLSGSLPDVGGIKIHLVDTMKLFPMGLSEIGELIGIPKINIGTYEKDKMKVLYEQDYNLFYKYAMTDAIIAVRAYKRFEELLSIEGMDIGGTIGSIGDKYLKDKFIESYHDDKELLYGLGYEIENTKGKRKRIRGVRVVSAVTDDFIRVLFGGRNETYIKGLWEGITVNDYDLVSAYVSIQTVMPTWDTSDPQEFNNPHNCFEYLKKNPFAHGYIKASVLSHKKGIKYPIIPVKNDNALVFVSSARNIFMTAKEFFVAYEDFETIKGFRATIYPVLYDNSTVSDFMGFLRMRRKAYKAQGDKLAEQTLKLIGNSTYGKFTQGYAGKKSIDLANSTPSRIVSSFIPHSRIANPLLSSYVTGSVRAIAYEILKEMQKINRNVFYWTTDGFATDSTIPDYIINGNFGLLSRAIADKLEKLTGSRTLLELKHQGMGWLSLKTRGYGMLEKTDEHNTDNDVMFKFTGLQLKGMSFDEKVSKIRGEIQALERFKDTKYPVISITPMHEWLRGKPYSTLKKVQVFNYDFDFKRMPCNVETVNGILCHETIPYKDIDEFLHYRDLYQDFLKGKRIKTGEKTKDGKPKYKWMGGKNKLITPEHYRQFFQYVGFRDMKIEGIERINEKTPKRLLANYLLFQRKFSRSQVKEALDIKDKAVRVAAECQIPIKDARKLIKLMREFLELETLVPNAIKDIIVPQRASLQEITEEFIAWLKTKYQNVLLKYVDINVIVKGLMEVVLSDIKTVQSPIEVVEGKEVTICE